MTTSTLQQRISKLTKSKVSKFSPQRKECELIKTLLDGITIIRPVYTTGSGYWSNTIDVTDEIHVWLDALKIKYMFTNDAPRGGKLGNKFIILTKITKD